MAPTMIVSLKWVYRVLRPKADDPLSSLWVCILFLLLLLPVAMKRRNRRLVILYGSRFGHFLSNTEFFFSDSNNNCVDLDNSSFFVLCNSLDSIELKKLIERAYGISIYSGIYGRAIFAINALLNIEVIDTRPLTAPSTFPFESELNKLIPKSSFSKKYVTLSVRNGNYSKYFQGSSESTTFRDTPLELLEPSILKLQRLGYTIFLVNKNPFDREKLSRLGVLGVDYRGLVESWSLIKGAEFHIDTCTATSIVAAFASTPVVNINTFYAGSFDTQFYTNGNFAIYLPMLLYDRSREKYCSVKETISFLKDMESDLQASTIYSKDYMESRGFFWRTNSRLSIERTIDEMFDLASGRYSSSELQDKFWEIYPDIWVNIAEPTVCYFDANVGTGLRVSTSYLEKFLD